MNHLIADSGIHFIVTESEFNPNEPLLLENRAPLKYSFYDTLTFDDRQIFGLLSHDRSRGIYLPVDEISDPKYDGVLRNPNGREKLDAAGVVCFNPECNTALFSVYDDLTEDMYSINTLKSYMVTDPVSGYGKVAAFELLLDKWLPMPMFRKEIDGITSSTPMGWCRMKIQRTGKGYKKGAEKFRLIWAFDTQLGEDELSLLRPFITADENGTSEFCLCNKADLLLDFMSSSEEFHAFSDYIASLLGIDTKKEVSSKYKAFYIYFLNFIRLIGASPDVTLHDNRRHDIFVDLVLDIGNSRTCGILFESGQFTKGEMLALRDLSEPWNLNINRSFDMRVVFRRADFGNDIVLDEEMFAWKSFVRIGEEAHRLIYRSLEEEGLSEKTTNYSSPKRYLWDLKPYEGQWENLVTTEDPFNVLLNNEVSVPALSDLFADDGTYTPDKNDAKLDLFDEDESEHRYSRSSLMTFAFIEIFQHAISQINSIEYREKKWGNVDCRRYIRNVIITCPTAMPRKEQIFLRQSAKNAYDAISKCTSGLRMANIIPAPEALKVIGPYEPVNQKVWSYDEASCCQLTYLYAEIAEKYKGEVNRFFESKGHVRPELAEEGYADKALTIGTIDIGAGTTDIMICSYMFEGTGQGKITPVPLFWDSFYLAGDDILRNIVQNVVIEGKETGRTDIGSISSALIARMGSMTNDEIAALPCVEDNPVYRDKVRDIISTFDEDNRKDRILAFASVLIHDFFGVDSSMMGYRERRCRNDFNTQVSVPIAQFMMELLRTHRPTKQYSYDEIFSTFRPSDYLLSHFEKHFGFRFESLQWRFDPQEVAKIVKATMEPLMKQLALVLFSQKCDIIVLAGRPTSLDTITELFIKYIPIAPDRLIRLNSYRVGNFFPTADGQGYFYDHKAIVAVGGMVGYQASHGELKGFVIDFSKMIQKMVSTANYIGVYNGHRQQVTTTLLSPTAASESLTVSVFPAFLGCRQLDSSIYQARPLYAIYNRGKSTTLQIRITREFQEDREKIVIEEALDQEFRNRKSDLEIVLQSLVDDGKYWLDKGEFELSIK